MDSPAAAASTPRIPLALILVGAGLSLVPAVGGAVALLAGAVLALSVGNPIPTQTRAWAHRLLPWAVVGLGAEMDLVAVARAGIHGIAYTAVSLTVVLLLGFGLSRLLRVESSSGFLISVGTAICGGSAIAAMAPVIRAREHQVSVALATVFLLNAVALLIFPPIGHLTQLGQDAFGLWAALAIHDTSSVVGAGLAYGERALRVATTIKLARALWIVPLSLGTAFFLARRNQDGATEASAPIKKPWFIVGFLATAAVVTWMPALRVPGHFVALAARRLLVVTLFLIGAGLSRTTVRAVGVRPFVQGLLLWLMVSAVSLAVIRFGLLAG